MVRAGWFTIVTGEKAECADTGAGGGVPAGSVVKNLPAKQETQETRVQSLSWEDPLEKEMETYSSILGWGIPWTEEPGRLQSMGSLRVGHD